ncbi:carbohydrate kinase [Rhizobium sp. R72]|uniref:PfkB family carbohydrate kinase n=1 Tax=unclassified Rhizobium TaxID=2613769 RepID=UPI000B533749|nr:MULTISPECIES: PfkB family carbohydrate kinase [unclassified Rhizobium]OWW04448.1 carbohydrate kinase [Rhizobium sp. R72]OWW05505.1 carbohydrate kinase [Rhizobium sp. R711]
MISAISTQAPPTRARHVLCVGAAVFDTLFRVRVMPTGQGKVLPYDMQQIAEGMAASAAFAVARLGGKASLWGAVGDDETGERIVADLAGSGIDILGVHRVAGARSAVSTILIDDDGERLIIPFYDPRLHQAVYPVTADDVAAFDAVLVDVRWPELALQALLAANKAGIPAVLDGDVASDGVIERLAPAATHIVFSQPAAECLAGTPDPVLIVRRLKQRFSHAFVSATFGNRGCYWFNDERACVCHLEAPRIAAIDTLAAGDIFHGTFALMLCEGMAIEDVMRSASMAAAIKCLTFGGRMGAPDGAELDDALRNWPARAVDITCCSK